MRRSLVVASCALLVVSIGACDEVATGPDAGPDAVQPLRGESPSTSMLNSNAPFKNWKQGFNHGTEGWITDDVPGPDGWCGDIEQVDRRSGSLRPSAGRGYAVVSHGACNDFYHNRGFDQGSGPAGAGVAFSTEWPTGGYTSELDIYLDPDRSAGNGFVYAVSILLLDQGYPLGLRYFMLPVMDDGGVVMVSDHEVSESGWYTFRHTFRNEGGQLAGEFELAQHGRTLFTEPVQSTAFTSEAIESFEATNVGNGYVWFVNIAEGLELPIDEHQVRRGS